MVPCPLCLQTFAVDPGGLTLEHAPPSKLGGRIVALTCDTCNNQQGSSLESNLIEYYRLKESLTGDSQRRFADATMQFDGVHSIRVKVNVSQSNWRVVPISKASNPKALDAISQSFTQGTGPTKLALQFRQPGLRTVRIALIRAAYLIALGQFGYCFAVNPGLDYVRQLLRLPNDTSLFPHGVLFDFQCADEFLGVSIVTQPVGMRAYLVVFDLFDGGKRLDRIGVVLPGWTNDPMTLYVFLDSINGLDTVISFEKISSELDLLLEAPLAALQHWNDRFARDDSLQS